MTKKLTLILTAISMALGMEGRLIFEGNANKPVEVTPEASTGLETVYVLDNTDGVRISYTATSPSSLSWQRYSNLGGGYAEPVPDVTRNGNTFTIKAENSDMGYIIDDGSRRTCYWVVNYSNHRLMLHSLEVNNEMTDCDRVVLNLNAEGGSLVFYTVNGRAVTLDREMKLIYLTLAYDGDSETWNEHQGEENIAAIHPTISVEAPYCDTEYILSGDRFMQAWKQEESVSSDTYVTKSVTAETTATQTERDIDNESGGSADGLGGSAPCVINFTARPTDAAIFKEWQFSKYQDFDAVSLSFQQDETDYTFTEQGTTYVRYVCADASGQCSYTSDIYTVNIGASKLQCPNAFSPGNQDGVNDEWKISYSSIISFECQIFNRWGTKICEMTDPSQGWDGRYKGKLVPSGVYFYVINALGADGVKYKLSGDINIINARRTGQTSSSEEGAVE